MRIEVDGSRCQGHNRCFLLAPELFDVDELGQALALNGGRVPPGLEKQARLAEANCPEFAIRVVEG